MNLILQVCLVLSDNPSAAAFDVAAEILDTSPAVVAVYCKLEREYEIIKTNASQFYDNGSNSLSRPDGTK